MSAEALLPVERVDNYLLMGGRERNAYFTLLLHITFVSAVIISIHECSHLPFIFSPSLKRVEGVSS